MALQTLLNGTTSDTNGTETGTLHSGPCTVHITQDSVFDGAHVDIETTPVQTAAKFGKAGFRGRFKAGDTINVNILGDYYLRPQQHNSGTSTVIYCYSTQ